MKVNYTFSNALRRSAVVAEVPVKSSMSPKENQQISRIDVANGEGRLKRKM
jgi:hypothetical protein